MNYELFQTVRAELGDTALKGSCLWNEGERWLCEIMERCVLPVIGGRRLEIVEVGTRMGTSAAILARYGHVTALDTVDHPEFATVIDIGKNAANRNGFRWRGVERRIVSGADEVKAILADLPFNLAHEDAAHQYEQLHRYWPELSKAGQVVFHDYDGSQPDVTRFVDEQRAHGGVHRFGTFAYWRAYPKVNQRPEVNADEIPPSHASRGAL